MISLDEARRRNRCRICEQDVHAGVPIVLQHGQEFAHEPCLTRERLDALDAARSWVAYGEAAYPECSHCGLPIGSHPCPRPPFWSAERVVLALGAAAVVLTCVVALVALA